MNGPDALDFGRASVTNIGNPHCVLAVADVAALKLEPLGKGIVSLCPANATRFSIFSGDPDLRRPFALGPRPPQRERPHSARRAQRTLRRRRPIGRHRPPAGCLKRGSRSARNEHRAEAK